MKCFRVEIGGITPHIIKAENEGSALRATMKRFKLSLSDLEKRNASIIPWEEHTVESLIKALSKLPRNLPVFFPNSSGTYYGSSVLYRIKGIKSVELKDDKFRAICLESHVVSSTAS